MKRFRYYMFDFDGTVADSQKYWQVVMPLCLRARGVPVTDEDIAHCMALPYPERWEYCRGKFGLTEADRPCREEIHGAVTRFYQTEVVWKPGVEKTLKALKEQGGKTVLFTATPLDMVRCALKTLDGEKYFDYLFSAADIGVGKGDPSSYRHCLSQLNASPEEVVMFEDAPYSMATAKGVGIYTVAVYESVMEHLRDEIDANCDRFVNTMTECLED